MAQLDAFKKEFLRVFGFALLSLFLIPVCAFLFVEHAGSERDRSYVARVTDAIERDAQMSAGAKAEAKEYFRANPPSSVCGNDNPEFAEYLANVCPPYSELWQYDLVRIVSRWTLIGGAAALFAIFAIGAVAFSNRRGQYISFLIGWNLLRVTSAVEVIVQGTLLVWLSFWVTAFFWERYFVKLIFIAGFLAGGAALFAIIGIFKRPPKGTGIDGELVDEKDAPTLWAHLRATAKRLETAPPDQIVAGIDTNFFVTEAPLAVGGRMLSGRSLFVSLPLLRILDRKEADAVLAHELAHFRGGDTATSARLGPKLTQYDHYCQLMRHGGATIAIFHLMYLYRFIFELALRRDSRDREFLADRVAAKLVSPEAIVSSLVKIAAYAKYRSKVEEHLFSQESSHSDKLGIADRIATGLAPYAMSVQFADSMKTASVPHPFDSHPPMAERIQNVGLKLGEQDYSRIVTAAPSVSWVNYIQTTDVIEQRLWAAYEQSFAAQHEMSLAYRYEPASPAELAIVLKYFPPVSFALKRNNKIEITYEGIELPEGELVSWDRVANLKYTDGMGGDVLEIVHPEKGLLGAKTTKVKLPGISKQREQIKQTLGNYWQRHKVMRQQAA